MKKPVTRPTRHEIPEGYVDGFASLADELNITPLIVGTSASVEESFSVVLPGLGSTGYAWSLRTPHEPLELVSQEATPDETQFGGMGTYTYVFRSPMPGHFTLWFDSKRPCEDEIKESREYRIHVKKSK